MVINNIKDLEKIRSGYQEGKREKTQIKISMSTCGISAGADKLFDFFTDENYINDLNLEISPAGCMGLCHSEPTIEVKRPGKEGVILTNVDLDKAGHILKELSHMKEIESDLPKDSKQLKIALRNCGFIDPGNIEEYIGRDGYTALGKVLTAMSPEDVIDEMKISGLRGRGGGGYPTGIKWENTKKSPGDIKYVVCNADEGDPGAFMDRSLLEGDPHSILEAMAICGYAIGAEKGVVYIRAEYPLAIERLKNAMDASRESGLLGSDIMGSGFNFDIEIRYGAGAFVCGEETALIHSMEGKRGEPTIKPPYPSVEGYWKKPTNVNNVETLANIPPIINKGGEWFRGIGTERSTGTKVFALAGKVKNVGLIEVPMGTTLKEVIFDIGGGIKKNREFKAVQTGGPSGGCLTANDLDTPIEFDTLIEKGSMMGSGGMIVMDEDDCMVAVSKFYLGFSVDESCGRCTPCRIGTKRLHEILTKITKGSATEKDIELMEDLSNTIKRSALCGLGKTAPNPVLSTIKNFPEEYRAHISKKKCPAKVCMDLVQFTITDACVGCTMCAKVCPSEAILGRVKEKHFIYQERCIKCGACYTTCRFNAINKI